MVATLARRHALALTSLVRDIPFSAGSFHEALGATENWDSAVFMPSFAIHPTSPFI